MRLSQLLSRNHIFKFSVLNLTPLNSPDITPSDFFFGALWMAAYVKKYSQNLKAVMNGMIWNL